MAEAADELAQVFDSLAQATTNREELLANAGEEFVALCLKRRLLRFAEDRVRLLTRTATL